MAIMKTRIQSLIESALASLRADGTLPADLERPVKVERTRDRSHGDFASNIVMTLAKPAGHKPRDLAEKLVAALPADGAITKVDIAGPGFINFHIADDVLSDQLLGAQKNFNIPFSLRMLFEQGFVGCAIERQLTVVEGERSVVHLGGPQHRESARLE